VSENYYYVDKTQFIELLEKETNPYQFFVRPRKFGKSLLLSMLRHYYDILLGVDRGLIMVDTKWYYNGYLFNVEATDRIYNPSMMLYFFDRIITEKKIPKKIIDDNLKTDYGRLQCLTLNEANREMLLQIVKDEGIESGYIDIHLHRSPLFPQVKYEWIFELKHLKASLKTMDVHRSKVKEQLQRYSRSKLMKDNEFLKKAVILFIGKNKYELLESDTI